MQIYAKKREICRSDQPAKVLKMPAMRFRDWPVGMFEAVVGSLQKTAGVFADELQEGCRADVGLCK